MTSATAFSLQTAIPATSNGRGLQTSALGHKADVCAAKRRVCLTPESGHLAGTAGGLDPLTSLNLQIREITLDHE